MKILLVFVLTFAGVFAEPPGGYVNYPSSGYGVPSSSSSSSSSSNSFGPDGNFYQGGQVYRHVYVHSAPDEPEDYQSRVIRVPGGRDKHVNIIFVKAPSASANQQTEVILPEQEQQKTIVYVLHKKFNADTDLKIRAPRPQAPRKPEVFFIRYKNQQQQQQDQQVFNGGYEYQQQQQQQQQQPPRPVYGTPL